MVIILNIILLALSFFLSIGFLFFAGDEVRRDDFTINILQIVFIITQYYLIIKIQNNFSEKLNKNIIYTKTRFSSVIFLSILLFLSIFMNISVYLHSIYMVIFFSILSFLSKEMKYSVLIQLLCLVSIYIFQDFTVIEGLRVKYFIRTIVSYI